VPKFNVKKCILFPVPCQLSHNQMTFKLQKKINLFFKNAIIPKKGATELKKLT